MEKAVIDKEVDKALFKTWQKHQVMPDHELTRLTTMFLTSKLPKSIGTSLELHYPGYMYMGPGTHVIERIMNGKDPINWLDQISKNHDIDYVKANGNLLAIQKADEVMVKSIEVLSKVYETEGVAAAIAKLGIKAKMLVNPMLYDSNKSVLSDYENQQLGYVMSQNYSQIIELAKTSTQIPIQALDFKQKIQYMENYMGKPIDEWDVVSTTATVIKNDV